jgi:O-acetyl-ADP-ribose deacetylase (regulator of RNase III)
MLDDDAIVLVNAVNCLGVMGGGIAKAFKMRWHTTYLEYDQVCQAKELKAGDCLLLPMQPDRLGRMVAHAATKDHWKYPSKIEWVGQSLASLAQQIEDQQIESVAVPALGCGLGGLEWADVKPLIEQHLSALDCDVRVYLPR